MNIIQISPFRFRELVKNHYSLDELYIMQHIMQGCLPDFKEKKIQVLMKGLNRKGILDDNGCITAAGNDLWESLFLPDEEELALNKIERVEDDFERWWKAFPGTDTIRIGGKIVFRGDRSLRNNKDKCKLKFHKILSEGEYTADDLIKAIQYEVQLKIEKSLKVRDNKLSYLKNSHAWLEQRAYESFIEEAREADIKPIKKPTSWDTIA